MVINTDTITSLTGTVSAISGTLASYGIYPQYTTPLAGFFAALFAFFSKGITNTPSKLGTEVK